MVGINGGNKWKGIRELCKIENGQGKIQPNWIERAIENNVFNE